MTDKITVEEYRKQGRKPRVYEESKLQQEIVAWCLWNKNLHPALEAIYHIPNAGKMDNKTGARLNREGRRKGFPDLCIPYQGYYGSSLYLELKSKNGRISKEQKKWRDILDAIQIRVLYPKTLDAAIETIKHHLYIYK